MQKFCIQVSFHQRKNIRYCARFYSKNILLDTPIVKCTERSLKTSKTLLKHEEIKTLQTILK